VAEVLGLNLDEVADWNCCGATEYISLSALPAYSLIARNLALAAQGAAQDLIAPCSACYLNLRRVDDYMEKHSDIYDEVNRALAAGGLHYEPGALSVRHLVAYKERAAAT
jgi:heterodisulfide reductase subunit B